MCDLINPDEARIDTLMKKTEKTNNDDGGILSEKNTNRLILILVIGIGLGSPIATIVGHWYAKKRTIEMLAKQLTEVPRAYDEYVSKNSENPEKANQLLPFFDAEKVAGISLHTIIRGTRLSFEIRESETNPLKLVERDSQNKLICLSEFHTGDGWSIPAKKCQFIPLIQAKYKEAP